MSKIDYITIAVVVVCISLLGLVFWKVADLNWAEEKMTTTEVEPIVEEEAAPFLDENYDVSDFVATDSSDMLLDNQIIEEEPLEKPKEEKIVPKETPKETPKVEKVTKVEPIKEEKIAKVEAPKPTLTEEYLVWGGTFSTRAGADDELAKFKKLGYSKAEVSLFDKGKYAVVIVGRFPTSAQAQSLVNELKTKHNISAIAKKKKL